MASPTSKSFLDKWQNNIDAFYAETLREGSETQRWIIERNGFSDLSCFKNHLAKCDRILDAGCGNGRITALLRMIAPGHTEIVGIDLVAADVARQNFKDVAHIHFETRDLTSDLSDLGKFDFIYCQEVLHHTVDPQKSFRNLCKLLIPGGELAVYVYKKKSPVREFVDDYIRNQITGLPYDEAIAHCREITEFGKALSNAKCRINIPAVKSLGIKEGEYDIQRLIYHFFAKCYWNPDVSLDENVIVNYDWYHPQIASRHTMDEVEAWFIEAGLNITHRCEDFYGITLRGTADL
jgi:SAM-dependent methyltransferase